MDWISILDEPIPRPKKPIDVLIWFGEDETCDHFRVWDEALFNMNSNNQNDWKDIINSGATHWMPITVPTDKTGL